MYSVRYDLCFLLLTVVSYGATASSTGTGGRHRGSGYIPKSRSNQELCMKPKQKMTADSNFAATGVLIRFCDEAGVARYGRRTNEDGEIEVLRNLNLFEVLQGSGEHHEAKNLLAPIEPTQIIGIGINYRPHGKEMKFSIPASPIWFLKCLNSVQNPGGDIVIPKCDPDMVDYEGELAVIIGKDCKDVSEEEALDYVFGYTIGNDVSSRFGLTLDKSGGQWCQYKSYDTFCPLGPHIVLRDDIPDPQNLKIRTMINGEVVQDSCTSNMIFSVRRLISSLSRDLTLKQGTVILTGTPEGVGMMRQPQKFLKAGDEITVEIEKIGKLTNKVVASK